MIILEVAAPTRSNFIALPTPVKAVPTPNLGIIGFHVAPRIIARQEL